MTLGDDAAVEGQNALAELHEREGLAFGSSLDLAHAHARRQEAMANLISAVGMFVHVLWLVGFVLGVMLVIKWA